MFYIITNLNVYTYVHSKTVYICICIILQNVYVKVNYIYIYVNCIYTYQKYKLYMHTCTLTLYIYACIILQKKVYVSTYIETKMYIDQQFCFMKIYTKKPRNHCQLHCPPFRFRYLKIFFSFRLVRRCKILSFFFFLINHP